LSPFESSVYGVVQSGAAGFDAAAVGGAAEGAGVTAAFVAPFGEAGAIAGVAMAGTGGAGSAIGGGALDAAAVGVGVALGATAMTAGGAAAVDTDGAGVGGVTTPELATAGSERDGRNKKPTPATATRSAPPPRTTESGTDLPRGERLDSAETGFPVERPGNAIGGLTPLTPAPGVRGLTPLDFAGTPSGPIGIVASNPFTPPPPVTTIRGVAPGLPGIWLSGRRAGVAISVSVASASRPGSFPNAATHAARRASRMAVALAQRPGFSNARALSTTSAMAGSTDGATESRGRARAVPARMRSCELFSPS
jgi:hypothetical protein